MRKIKGYNFTESDLDTITLSNIVSGVAFSLAAGVATFCVDINKDILIADQVSQTGLAIQFTINWIGIPIAIALAVVGIVAQWKRGSVITRVKSESENVPD